MTALLLGPKTAILRQDLESDSALQDALTFLAISFGITFIAEIPFLPGGSSKELVFGILAIGSALAFVWNVVFLILAWKIVGGKLAGKKVIVATSYFSGVSTIIFLSFYLVAVGALKALDPVSYEQVIATGSATDLTSGGVQIFNTLALLGLLATFAWIFCIWGAYRELMQTSRLRSAVALLLFAISIPVLVFGQYLMVVLVMPPNVPGDLAGKWLSLTRQTDASGITKVDELDYSFAAGTYRIQERHGSYNGRCLVLTTRIESGQMDVLGSTLDLTPRQRTQSTDDQCTGRHVDTPQERTKAQYHFEITRQPPPWKLCLSDRFGQFCLTPEK